MTTLPHSTHSSASSSSIPPLNLKIGDTFNLQGPSIWRDITPPSNYPPPAPPFAQPPRSIIPELVGPNGLAESSHTWQVELSDVFEYTKNQINQVVKGRIRKLGSETSHRVDLSLTFHSLPSCQLPHIAQAFHLGTLNALSAEVEAGHYNTYRVLQGREIPICYGIFAVTLQGWFVHVVVREELYRKWVFEIWEWYRIAREAEPRARLLSPFKYSDRPVGCDEHLWFTGNMTRAKVSTPFSRVYRNVSIRVEPPCKLTPYLYNSISKVNADLFALSRFLSCDRRFLPNFDLIEWSLAESSTPSTIHYIHNQPRALILVENVKQELAREYAKSAGRRIGSTIFELEDFPLHLPLLLLMAAEDCPVDEALERWTKLTAIMDLHGVVFEEETLEALFRLDL